MKKRTLFQTLEDKHNDKAIEEHGPFICDDKQAWLCEGYYFWDAGIDTARWWGETKYANSIVQKGYIVCKTSYDYGAENFFDIAGDSRHLQDFWAAVHEVEVAFPGEVLTVAQVLAFLREDDEFTKQFCAVRSYPISSRKNLRRLFFAEGNTSYMEEEPPIQLCVWNDLDSFLLEPFVVQGSYPYKKKWISMKKW